MRRPAAAISLVLLVSLGAGCASGRPAPVRPANAAPTTALAVDSMLQQMARMPLWPGFSPLSAPLALFDGVRSYLFRHPRPPVGYVALTGHRDVVARDGRDPAITGNTSVLLDGVATATVMMDPALDARTSAALTVHELFHVFQRARHPSWQGNEADLFTYPVEDSAALALRREETSALANAVRVTALDSVRCWARAFTDARHRRFALIGQAASTYERASELNEGLAQYVERRAAGTTPALDPADLPAAQVRQRAYAIGAAQADVLDRIRPEWRDVLERAPTQATIPLDSLVRDAAASSAAPPACSAGDAQRARWTTQAGAEARALIVERRRARDDYLSRSGWRIVVEADGSPFFPQRFDPLNVARLSETEILHTRYLTLQGPLGAIDVLGGSALTEGVAGQHPLFAGVRRVTIAGLVAVPTVRDSAGVLVVDVPGASLRLRGARADTTARTIRLRRP